MATNSSSLKREQEQHQHQRPDRRQVSEQQVGERTSDAEGAGERDEDQLPPVTHTKQQVRSKSIRVKLKESNITNRRVELFEQLSGGGGGGNQNGHATPPKIPRGRSPSMPVHSKPAPARHSASGSRRGVPQPPVEADPSEECSGIWISVGGTTNKTEGANDEHISLTSATAASTSQVNEVSRGREQSTSGGCRANELSCASGLSSRTEDLAVGPTTRESVVNKPGVSGLLANNNKLDDATCEKAQQHEDGKLENARMLPHVVGGCGGGTGTNSKLLRQVDVDDEHKQQQQLKRRQEASEELVQRTSLDATKDAECDSECAGVVPASSCRNRAHKTSSSRRASDEAGGKKPATTTLTEIEADDGQSRKQFEESNLNAHHHEHHHHHQRERERGPEVATAVDVKFNVAADCEASSSSSLPAANNNAKSRQKSGDSSEQNGAQQQDKVIGCEGAASGAHKQQRRHSATSSDGASPWHLHCKGGGSAGGTRTSESNDENKPDCATATKTTGDAADACCCCCAPPGKRQATKVCSCCSSPGVSSSTSAASLDSTAAAAQRLSHVADIERRQSEPQSAIRLTHTEDDQDFAIRDLVSGNNNNNNRSPELSNFGFADLADQDNRSQKQQEFSQSKSTSGQQQQTTTSWQLPPLATISHSISSPDLTSSRAAGNSNGNASTSTNSLRAAAASASASGKTHKRNKLVRQVSRVGRAVYSKLRWPFATATAATSSSQEQEIPAGTRQTDKSSGKSRSKNKSKKQQVAPAATPSGSVEVLVESREIQLSSSSSLSLTNGKIAAKISKLFSNLDNNNQTYDSTTTTANSITTPLLTLTRPSKSTVRASILNHCEAIFNDEQAAESTGSSTPRQQEQEAGASCCGSSASSVISEREREEVSSDDKLEGREVVVAPEEDDDQVDSFTQHEESFEQNTKAEEEAFQQQQHQSATRSASPIAKARQLFARMFKDRHGAGNITSSETGGTSLPTAAANYHSGTNMNFAMSSSSSQGGGNGGGGKRPLATGMKSSSATLTMGGLASQLEATHLDGE